MLPLIPPNLTGPLIHGSTQIIKWVWQKSNSPANPLPNLQIDVATEIEAEGPEGEFLFLVLEHNQFQEIQEFLADPTIISLFRLNFIQHLAPEDALSYISEIANFPTFQRLAREWCRNRSQTWSDLAEHLWLQVTRSHELIVGHLHAEHTYVSDLSDALIDRFFFGRLLESNVPEYVRLINELAQNETRQHELVTLLYDCARRTASANKDEFMILGLQEDRAKFDDLYINRTLVDAGTGTEISASNYLDVDQSCPRVVVIGDPGVGKSTLTSWVRWKMASNSTQKPSAPPPVVITLVARYDLVDSSSSVMSAIVKHFEADFLVGCDERQVAYLAATGWMTLIVDGIDEISDQDQRRKIVDQINSIAEVYPALPIICTTRRTGFEVRVFQTPPFTVLQLDKYSEDQVSEYAHKWFSGHQSHLKAERFLGESRTLGDLITNPLLLALLCTLYRQYDYIPESRRELYLRCAALMFYEWDPRRGISIPNLFKREGEAILREIALLLTRKGGVGASIDENQLLAIVKGHLEDKGLDPVGAISAAKELLEYCSRRAWILSKVASRDRIDYFSFTHRTFFEFFAAEATIRKLNHQYALAAPRLSETAQGGDLGPVSRTILDTFSADPTSVMPELLLQTADDLMGGMSTPILDELLRVIPRSDRGRRADIAALCIRLVAAGGAHAGIVDRVFNTVANTWSEQGNLTELSKNFLSDFRALLNIAPAHRRRFIVKCESDCAGLGRHFLQRYARLSILGESGLYSDEWRGCALTIMNGTSPLRDDFEAKYRWQSGIISLEEAIRGTSAKGLLRLAIGDETVEGVLWDALSLLGATESRDRILVSAHKLLTSNDGVLKDSGLGRSLVTLAERLHLPEGITVPDGLSRVITALMPRGQVAQWAQAIKRPELLVYDEVIGDLQDSYRGYISARRRGAKQTELAEDRFKNAHKRYYELYRERPPRWLFDHLAPQYAYPYDREEFRNLR